MGVELPEEWVLLWEEGKVRMFMFSGGAVVRIDGRQRYCVAVVEWFDAWSTGRGDWAFDDLGEAEEFAERLMNEFEGNGSFEGVVGSG